MHKTDSMTMKDKIEVMRLAVSAVYADTDKKGEAIISLYEKMMRALREK